jgi:tetratricopeptide (TPR) repeat protein
MNYLFRRAIRATFISAVLGSAALAQDAASIATWQQVVQSNPKDPTAWVKLGNAQLAAGDSVSAKDSFLEAIALDYISGDAHFGLGLSQYEQGDYPAALFEFNEVARLFPDSFNGHFNRGVTLAKLRDFDLAAEAFREAIAQADPEASDQEKVNAYLGLAGQLKRSEDYAGAAEAYAQALELAPGDAELAYLKGEALYRAGQGLEALTELSSLETQSSDYRVSALIADIYVQQEQPDYAMRSLERALSKASGAADTKAEATLLVKLGLLQQDLGRDPEAVASFQRASTSDPSDWQARYYLGTSYLKSGDFNSALGQLEQAAAFNPESAEIQIALASAYEGTSRSTDMQRAAETVMSLSEDPNLLAEAQFVKGRALFMQGNYEDALSIFSGLIEGSFQMQDASAPEGQEAVMMANQAENPSLQLYAGLSEYKLENYVSAVQSFERAVQLDPESLAAQVNLGAAYIAAKRYEDAELVYQMITESNPNDAQAFFNLGLSMFNQSNKDAAKEAWLRSSALGYAPAQEALQKYYQ